MEIKSIEIELPYRYRSYTVDHAPYYDMQNKRYSGLVAHYYYRKGENEE